MITEKRIREIVREEIELMAKEAREKVQEQLARGKTVFISPSWGGEIFPKVREKAREHPSLKR